MSTNHTYTAAEMDPLTSATDITRRAVAAGYTNPVVATHTENGTVVSWGVTVDEDGVVKATLLSDIKDATPTTLQLGASTLDVVSDGVSTGSVTVTGPANGVVDLSWDGLLPAAQKQVTLDGAGSGAASFGPVSSAWRTATPIRVRFTLQESVIPPLSADLELSFTPG